MIGPPKKREQRRQSGKINKDNQPELLQEGSLKERVWKAIVAFEKFDTFDQLFAVVRRKGEQLDYHNVTHVLNSLQQQGKVAFERGSGSSAGRTPRNIRLTKSAMRDNGSELTKQVSSEILEAAKKLAEQPANLHPVVVDDLATPEEAQAAIDAGEKILAQEQDLRFMFPLISRLSKRKEILAKASDLVEDLEPEIAIQLLEAAGKPMTELEDECVKLFKAYQDCRKPIRASWSED